MDSRAFFLSNTRLLVAVFFLIFLVMCYAGLRQKGFHFKNDVSWLPNENGIQLGPQGIAFTKNSPGHAGRQVSPGNEISIQLAIRSTFTRRKRLSTILCFWNRGNSDAIALCQWNNRLILFKDKGFATKGHSSKISAPISTGEKYLVSITSSRENGSRIYLNDHAINTSESLCLMCSKNFLSEISLGSLPSGRNNWQGVLYALKVYHNELSPDEVGKRYEVYRKTGVLPNDEKTKALYYFSEQNGNWAKDEIGKYGNLYLPQWFIPPKRQFFMTPWNHRRLTASLLGDFIMNFFGFVPFGFFLAAFINRRDGISGNRIYFLITLFSGTLSLAFEFFQGFIPTRTSQISDVLLNVIGALIGAWIFIRFSLSDK